MMAQHVRLGLTGGIGSGKSTVAQMLVKLGAGLVDADAIAREVTAPGGLAMTEIARSFGPDFITPEGAMDRDKMRALAYQDPASRQRLEAIIHPLVGQENRNRTELALGQGRTCVVFDIPLLVESRTWRQQLDHVLVVDCTPEVQIIRVMARSQLSRPEVEKIMAVQATRQRRLSAADSIIFNDTLSLPELAAEVQQLGTRFGLSSGII
jgi:dephospho-CoA kinase